MPLEMSLQWRECDAMSALLNNSNVERIDARAGIRGDSRPRVLHFITNLGNGGTERQCVELLNRMDKNRFDVRLAVLRREGPLLEQMLVRFPDLQDYPLTAFYNPNAARQFLRFRQYLKKERILILHAHDFYAGILGVVAARLTGVRVIAAQRHLKLSDRAVHEIGQRFTHKMAHRILVNSEAIRDFIVTQSNAPAEKIVVIRNGLNEVPNVTELREEQRASLRRELHLKDDAVIVGSVARLHPVKGHCHLLNAAARVLAEAPDTHFVLVGDGELRADVERQISELGIGNRIHLLGDRTDASQLVAGFDLALLSSLHEGLPNTVMEAMAVAVPVVATNVGGANELIKDYESGFLVPPAKPEAMAEQILFALNHRDQTELIGLRGRRSILSQFSMQGMVESTEKLYLEILGRREV